MDPSYWGWADCFDRFGNKSFLRDHYRSKVEAERATVTLNSYAAYPQLHRGGRSTPSIGNFD